MFTQENIDAAIERCGPVVIVGTVGDITVSQDNYVCIVKVDGSTVLSIMRKDGGLKDLVDLLDKTILD